MLIGQLSTKTGFSRDTIRFYEKQGLIPEGTRPNEFNNYKDYPNSTLERLLIIKRMKGFGLTLSEISQFLELLVLNAASCENVSQKMFDKIKIIDQKIKELQEMRKLITDGINSCPSPINKDENCPLITGDLS